MGRSACSVLLFVILPFSVLSAASTQNPPASDPQALTYASQSIAAITGGVNISDVTLAGNVTWTAGSDADTGTVTLLASGTGESRMDLELTGGVRTEIRDASTGTALGKWIVQSGASGKFAFHNCQTDAVWFFPALGSLVGGSNVVFSYIGQESHNGTTVQHIQSYVYQSALSPDSASSLQRLSTVDFYLDATTLLPSAVAFSAHPDNDAGNNIAVEADFSNYQTINGVTVPMHIQKFLQGTLTLDLTISSVTFNTGIALSNFAVN